MKSQADSGGSAGGPECREQVRGPPGHRARPALGFYPTPRYTAAPQAAGSLSYYSLTSISLSVEGRLLIFRPRSAVDPDFPDC